MPRTHVQFHAFILDLLINILYKEHFAIHSQIQKKHSVGVKHRKLFNDVRYIYTHIYIICKCTYIYCLGTYVSIIYMYNI